MRLILLALSIAILGISCEKPETYYEQPVTMTDQDTTSWEDSYVDSGVLTTSVTPTSDTLLFNTKWVVTKVNVGFTNSFPNDTIWFDTQTTYRIALGIGGGFGAQRAYSISSLPLSNNMQLVMTYWSSLGGSHYSGEIGGLAIQDGIIVGSEFVDNQNYSLEYLVWMQKL